MAKNSKEPKSNTLRLLLLLSCPDNLSGYEAAKELFSITELPWEDFFMKFYPGTYNAFTAPGQSRWEFFGKAYEMMPDLGKYMQPTYHDPCGVLSSLARWSVAVYLRLY